MNNKRNHEIKKITIEDLFTSNDVYNIPLYQRNFDWGMPEIKQLIRDIADFSVKKDDRNYYLGILVVYNSGNGKSEFEVVDGQQRLTVLSLIMMALKNEIEIDKTKLYNNGKLNDFNTVINFAHRPNAQATLNAIMKGTIEQLNSSNLHSDIRSVYQQIPDILQQELKEVGCNINNFYKYLSNNVVLYRSPLPENTELNHYFEVMNNRGEQLEKHEILKADFLSIVNDYEDEENKKDIRDVVNQVWEACSDMNRYVQYSFDKNVRKKLFGKHWNKPYDKKWFKEEGFEQLLNIIKPQESSNSNEDKTIDSILKYKPQHPDGNPEDRDRNSDFFQPVINFPNFLLQVLRIYEHNYNSLQPKSSELKYASLDDKVLIEQFEPYLNHNDKGKNIKFVKCFITLLLKIRFLLDQFVIKRRYKSERDEWSLLKLNYYPEDSNRKQDSVGYVNTFGEESDEKKFKNRKALMLLTMFHVSTPTQNYKHWLTAVLNYLLNEKDVNSDDYINYLENLARKLFYDRFVSEIDLSYDKIVFLEKENIKILHNKCIDNEYLKYGSIKNNLIFNYLDYLIWKDNEKDKKITEFEFKFRSSVEHFNPRTPKDRHNALPEELLHSFGNLCLIAHGKNSSYSNNNPLAKAYSDTSNKPLDSLKLYLMIDAAKKNNKEDKYGGWPPESVETHQNNMISLFKNQLNNK